MSEEPFKTFTGRDMMMSQIYAIDQINKKICNDADIRKKFCFNKDKPDCITWKESPWKRIWQMPNLVTDKQCDTDNDCQKEKYAKQCIPILDRNLKKYCAFRPSDRETGKCVLVDKDSCLKHQTLPYKCDSNGICKSIDEDKGPTGPTGKDDTKSVDKTQYVEWHGSDILQCDNDTPCYSPDSFCENGSCNCKHDRDCPGSYTCSNIDPKTGKGKCSNGGRCVIGNDILRLWCENPNSRCLPDKDGKLPPLCQNETTTGVTDVPPFFYDQNAGKCYMTSAYCDSYGLEYNAPRCDPDKGKNCPNKEDICQIWNPDRILNADPGRCVGPSYGCTESVGQQVGEFFLGNTVFKMVFTNAKCRFGHSAKNSPKNFSQNPQLKENYTKNIFQSAKNIIQFLNDCPEVVEKIADEKVIFTKYPIKENFIKSINLYMITWDEKANVSPKIGLGLLGEEVKKVYPELVVKKDGYEYIRISKKQIKNREMKIIFFIVSGAKNILQSILFQDILTDQKN